MAVYLPGRKVLDLHPLCLSAIVDWSSDKWLSWLNHCVRCCSVSSSHSFTETQTKSLIYLLQCILKCYTVSLESLAESLTAYCQYVSQSVYKTGSSRKWTLCFTVQIKKRHWCIMKARCLLDTCIFTKLKTWMFFSWKVDVLEMYVFHRTVTYRKYTAGMWNYR